MVPDILPRLFLFDGEIHMKNKNPPKVRKLTEDFMEIILKIYATKLDREVSVWCHADFTFVENIVWNIWKNISISSFIKNWK